MTKANAKLSALRHKLVNKMIELVAADVTRYNQNRFPEARQRGSITVCGTPYCAAGFLIEAKSARLFKQLCKLQADPDSRGVSWFNEAQKVIAVGYDEAESLFGGVTAWPGKFSSRYYRAATARGRFSAFKARWKQWLKEQDKQLAKG